MKSKVLIFLFALSLAGCQKEPNASFTTDKEEYTAGESIELKNTSENEEFSEWIMPDGKIFNCRNARYNVLINDTNTELTFKLKVFSENKRNSDVAIKTIKLKPLTGDVIFWLKTGAKYAISEVLLAGKKLPICYDELSAPACGKKGSATFNDMKPGTYTYIASDKKRTWNGTVEVKGGVCTPVQLGFDLSN